MSKKLVPFMWFLACLVGTVGYGQTSGIRTSSEVFGNGPRHQKVTAVAPPEQVEPAVHHVQPSIYIGVMGQVTNPGVYEFVGSVPTLSEIIKHAGGLTRYASRELYVVSAKRPMTEIDIQRFQNFQFESGDVLLVETPARYYRQLGQVGAEVTKLSDIHTKTQLALLNLIDRPVILNVPPGDARMASLLALLKQDQQAMLNLQMVLPPNAHEIPPSAMVAPGLLSSGSVLLFDPRAIQSKLLPEMPAAIRVSSPVTVHAASYNAPETRPTHDLAPNSSVPPATTGKGWSLPPIPTEHFAKTRDEDAGFVDLSDKTAKESPTKRVKEKSDETLVADAETKPNNLPEMFISPNDQTESKSPLSSDQRGYVVGFLVLLGVCGFVFWIRNRDRSDSSFNGRYQFSSKRYDSLPEVIPPGNSGSPKRIVPKTEPLKKRGAAASPTSKTEVSADVSPIKDAPVPAVAAQTAPIEKRSAPKPMTVPVSMPAPPPVPASIMDRILLQELIEGTLPTELEALPEEKVIADEIDHRKPTIEAAAEPPKASEPQTYRVDEPHASVPHPLFPIIWNIPASKREPEPVIPRYVPEEAAKPAAFKLPQHNNEPAASAKPPVAEKAVETSHLKHEVHAAASTPKAPHRPVNTGGALLDRVLLAIQRERRK